MSAVLTIDIIAWMLVFCGWGLNYSNAKNYTKDKNNAAIICFGVAFVLFMIAMGMLIFVA